MQVPSTLLLFATNTPWNPSMPAPCSIKGPQCVTKVSLPLKSGSPCPTLVFFAIAEEAAIASITTIMATTVNNTMMRLIMRYPLPVKGEARGSPAVLRNRVSMMRYKT